MGTGDRRRADRRGHRLARDLLPVPGCIPRRELGLLEPGHRLRGHGLGARAARPLALSGGCPQVVHICGYLPRWAGTQLTLPVGNRRTMLLREVRTPGEGPM